MTYQEGMHVRVDCAGPNHLQATGRIASVQTVRFSDGLERLVYAVVLDRAGTDGSQFYLVVGDGEIVEVIHDQGPDQA